MIDHTLRSALGSTRVHRLLLRTPVIVVVAMMSVVPKTFGPPVAVARAAVPRRWIHGDPQLGGGGRIQRAGRNHPHVVVPVLMPTGVVRQFVRTVAH